MFNQELVNRLKSDYGHLSYSFELINEKWFQPFLLVTMTENDQGDRLQYAMYTEKQYNNWIDSRGLNR